MRSNHLLQKDSTVLGSSNEINGPQELVVMGKVQKIWLSFPDQ